MSAVSRPRRCRRSCSARPCWEWRYGSGWAKVDCVVPAHGAGRRRATSRWRSAAIHYLK